MVTYEDTQAGFSIQHPDTWFPWEQDPAIESQGGNNIAAAAFISPPEDQQDQFAETVSVIVRDLNQTMTLEEFTAEWKDMIDRTYQDYTITYETDNATLGGNPAYRVMLDTTLNATRTDEPIVDGTVVVGWTLDNSNNRAYIITVLLEKSKLEQYQDPINPMIDSFTLLGTSTAMNNETTATETMPSTPTSTTIYQSNVDGFRVGVPNGWVVEELGSTSPVAQYMERTAGSLYLAKLCPLSEASPDTGGKYSCISEGSEGSISARILRFDELLTRPELGTAVQENGTISMSDFYAFLSQWMEESTGTSAPSAELNLTDTTVNVIDPQTGQTMETTPASYVEVTYTDDANRPVNREFLFLVLSNGTNTGYLILPTIPGQSIEEGQQQPPSEILQVFDSFELLMTSPTTTPSPGEEPSNTSPSTITTPPMS
jgi:hypothetical protein